MATPTVFYNTLVAFLRALTQRFPENKGATTALSSLELFGQQPSLHLRMQEGWAHSTAAIQQEIHDKDAAIVSKTLDANDNPMISGISATSVLMNDDVDEQTKESVWKYLQTLTAMSHSTPLPTDVTITTPVPKPMAGPGDVTAAVPAAVAPKVPDVGNIMDGFSKAMPQVMDSINQMLKSKDGENPLGDIIKQMMNPNQLQTGMSGNIMANMMENTDATVMEDAALQTGLSVDDITYRLQRLENLEKSRAYRKQMKNNRNA